MKAIVFKISSDEAYCINGHAYDALTDYAHIVMRKPGRLYTHWPEPFLYRGWMRDMRAFEGPRGTLC